MSYDAGGQRTVTIRPNGVKSYYPFPNLEEEVNGGTVTVRKTYLAAGQPVAQRTVVKSGTTTVSSTLYFVFTDHPSGSSGQAWAARVC